MFKKSSKGYYFWEEFANVDGIIHGFSTRSFGDMNIRNPRSSQHFMVFLSRLGVDNKHVVKMNQVHGGNVSFVSALDHEKIINDTDGLIASDKNILLVGTFADCVPVLFLDKNKKIFGIAHAGWRGAYKEIVKVFVEQMFDKGSCPSDILIGIGPSIRSCCYNIDKKKAEIFKNKFPKLRNIITRKDGQIFLDLAMLIKCRLTKSGILKQNIQDCLICTKDNLSDFYSYRGEHGRKSFGLSAAIIGRV